MHRVELAGLALDRSGHLVATGRVGGLQSDAVARPQVPPIDGLPLDDVVDDTEPLSAGRTGGGEIVLVVATGWTQSTRLKPQFEHRIGQPLAAVVGGLLQVVHCGSPVDGRARRCFTPEAPTAKLVNARHRHEPRKVRARCGSFP